MAEYTAGMTYQAFLKDMKTQDAGIRNLQIIGEATKSLSDDLRKSMLISRGSDGGNAR